jgi:hypothetical protein
MFNWNPFKKSSSSNNKEGIEVSGPGSNNVKIINLSNNAGTQIIIGPRP